jgi:predicted transcriptional regulator
MFSSKELVSALDLPIREVIQYYAKEDLLLNSLFKVLDLGVLPTRIYLTMYRCRKIWKTSELAKIVGQARPHVYEALMKLCKAGFVDRVSRTEWVLVDVTNLVTF